MGLGNESGPQEEGRHIPDELQPRPITHSELRKKNYERLKKDQPRIPAARETTVGEHPKIIIDMN